MPSCYSLRKGEWFSLWVEDRKNIICTMHRNILSDIELGGYDPAGKCVMNAMVEVSNFSLETSKMTSELMLMDEDKRDKRAYKLLRKSGAI